MFGFDRKQEKPTEIIADALKEGDKFISDANESTLITHEERDRGGTVSKIEGNIGENIVILNKTQGNIRGEADRFKIPNFSDQGSYNDYSKLPKAIFTGTLNGKDFTKEDAELWWKKCEEIINYKNRMKDKEKNS